jgi:alpha-1,6-mannosyltransferase
LLVFLCIMALAFFRSNESSSRLFTTMLFAVSIYLLFATTVHPWYVATPLLLSLFTSYRFPIIWSCVVFLSYSAYRTPNFEESMAWIALEYFIVIGYGIYEISTKKPFQKLTS